MYSFHSLLGRDRLREYSLPELRPDTSLQHQVDLPAKQLFKQELDIGKIEEIDRLAERHQQIDVGVGAGLVAGDGAKQAQAGHLQRRQLRPVLAQDAQRILPAHYECNSCNDLRTTARWGMTLTALLEACVPESV